MGRYEAVISPCPFSDYHFWQGNAFPGLLGLINAYVDTLDVDEAKRQKINKYLDLVKRRSNGRPCLA